MDCKCGNPITSPKISGDLCTKCYFKSRNVPNVTEVVKAIGTEPEVIEHNTEPQKEKPPTISLDKNQTRDPNLKYCQSCIERGYGLKIATREFRKGEFICDNCFGPMIDNTLGYAVERAEIERVIPDIDYEKPILNQVYDLLGIPEELRFTKSEQVLKHRNDIFAFHARAIVNQDLQEITANIEQLQVILFQIKIQMEPLTDYIQKAKAEAREQSNLEGIQKSKKEFTKGTGSASKVKLSQDQKMADVMFKKIEPDAKKRLELYQKMVKEAREKEFKKITG